MELKPGTSALVTEGANGIGKAIALALVKKGAFVTIVDFSKGRGTETASLVETVNKKFNPDIKLPLAIFVKCDVTSSEDISAASEKHVEVYESLDVCINCAGVGSTVKDFDVDESDGLGTWRRITDINFIALVDCTRIAIQTMMVNLGSRGGLNRCILIQSIQAVKVVLFCLVGLVVH